MGNLGIFKRVIEYQRRDGMQLHSIVQYDGLPLIVQEDCLLADNGDYVGVESGKSYYSSRYKPMRTMKAKVVSVDDSNKTGMLHLYEDVNDEQDENKSKKKSRFIGCYITIRPSHLADGLEIYYCYELKEYFSESEIEIL